MLKVGYSELSEEDINKMSLTELREALIRIVNLKEVVMQDHRGSGIPSDAIADAIRGRR